MQITESADPLSSGAAIHLDAKGLAALLPFSPRHIGERIAKYKDFPPARRIGRKRVWVEAEIRAWIETKKEG